MIDFAIQTFKDILVIALPIAVVFEMGNLIVSTIMKAAFGGKLWLGR